MLRLRLAMTDNALSRLQLCCEFDQFLSNFRTDTTLRFFGSGANMRRTDHVFKLEKSPVGRRFLSEDIQCRASNLAADQRFVKRIFVDDTTAGTVDDADAI